MLRLVYTAQEWREDKMLRREERPTQEYLEWRANESGLNALYPPMRKNFDEWQYYNPATNVYDAPIKVSPDEKYELPTEFLDEFYGKYISESSPENYSDELRIENLEKRIKDNEAWLKKNKESEEKEKNSEENILKIRNDFIERAKKSGMDTSKPPRYTHQGWTYFEPETKTYIGQTHVSPEYWYDLPMGFLNDFYGKDVFSKEKPDFEEFKKIMAEQNVPSNKAPIKRGQFWRYFNPIKNAYTDELIEPEKYYNAPQEYIDKFFGSREPAAAAVSGAPANVSNENISPVAAAYQGQVEQPVAQGAKSPSDIWREITAAIRHKKFLERNPTYVPQYQQPAAAQQMPGQMQRQQNIINSNYNIPAGDNISPAMISQMALMAAQNQQQPINYGGRPRESTYQKIMKNFLLNKFSPDEYVEDEYGI